MPIKVREVIKELEHAGWSSSEQKATIEFSATPKVTSLSSPACLVTMSALETYKATLRQTGIEEDKE